MTGQISRRVKTFPTGWTDFVLVFQVILAYVTLQLVLSRVPLPTDITNMVDTLICGFLSKMDHIDVILKCGLRAALIAAVFLRAEEGSLR